MLRKAQRTQQITHKTIQDGSYWSIKSVSSKSSRQVGMSYWNKTCSLTDRQMVQEKQVGPGFLKAEVPHEKDISLLVCFWILSDPGKGHKECQSLSSEQRSSHTD